MKLAAGKYELRQVVDAHDWVSYHRIGRTVLYEARGRFGMYDENYPDDRNSANQPLLLLFEGNPVCAFRLDRTSDGIGIIRRMAVEQAMQRRGHGRAAMSLLVEWAQSREMCAVEVNSAADAVPFYQRLGFELIDANREAPLLRLELHKISN